MMGSLCEVVFKFGLALHNFCCQSNSLSFPLQNNPVQMSNWVFFFLAIVQYSTVKQDLCKPLVRYHLRHYTVYLRQTTSGCASTTISSDLESIFWWNQAMEICSDIALTTTSDVKSPVSDISSNKSTHDTRFELTMNHHISKPKSSSRRFTVMSRSILATLVISEARLIAILEGKRPGTVE